MNKDDIDLQIEQEEKERQEYINQLKNRIDKYDYDEFITDVEYLLKKLENDNLFCLGVSIKNLTDFIKKYHLLTDEIKEIFPSQTIYQLGEIDRYLITFRNLGDDVKELDYEIDWDEFN